MLLQSLCSTFRAPYGFVALTEEQGFEVAANCGVSVAMDGIDAGALVTDETKLFSPAKELDGVNPIAILCPLHFGGEQIGIIAVAERATGAGYSEEDVILLQELAYAVASVIHTARLQAESVGQIATLLGEVRQREHELQAAMRRAIDEEPDLTLASAETKEEATALVEDALRHLHDYSYLGNQALSRLRIVGQRLDVQAIDYVTHVDRGKVLKEVLVGAIERLRPCTEGVPALPAREWHPYLILHDCYLQEKLNREVMAELYISEGTFNRTRRRALQAVTRTLAEMERITCSQAADPRR